MRTKLVLGIALAVVGCRYRPQPVPILGDRSEITRIAGDWEGEYWSQDSHRNGSITFQITAKGDSAFGDVLMPVPAGEQSPRPIDPIEQHLRHARSADLLGVRFVAISGGRVRGELEQYIAPDCECLVQTTFTGTIRGNVISGTYLTMTDWGGRQQGEWRVERVQP